jgi:hypothetical protein
LRLGVKTVPKPIGNGLQVFSRQSFEIGPTNAVEAAAGVHDRWEVVAICEEDPFADLIGQTHECRKLLPRQRRSGPCGTSTDRHCIGRPRSCRRRPHQDPGRAGKPAAQRLVLDRGPDFFGPYELLGG